ncbi:ATP-binding cassette domain-containing protein [Fulvivirgaceae bacterium PWU5]|uniref:ATP-binding cassette domain-containing protein n=1 Tax=Dawidia cretensis TaxID=2782350 RepID=A0AAP2DV33_9BACT|nr:ABC transporter transmembrane domain-containing protein [Dawidia cretensis]MBT1706788.1 ATP-binding cassette domain-containing protein [Dawidia cretensis]
MAKQVKEPLKEEEKRKLNKANLKNLVRVFRFMMPYKGIFILGLTALAFSTVTLLAFPRLCGMLLDIADGKPSYFETIDQAAIALIFILLVQAIFSFVRVYTFSIVTERSMGSIRKTIYEKIIWLPLTFFDNRRVGEIMSRLTSDISTLQDTFSTTLAELLRQVLTLVLGTVILFYMTPKLAVFMLLTFPVLVISALIFGKFIRKLSSKTQDRLAAANVIVEESLQSIPIVKAFTNETFETKRYSNAIEESIRIAIYAARYRGLFISFVIFVIFSGIVAVGWYGAGLVQSKTTTTGELFSFVLYTTFIGASIAGLGDIYTQIQRSIGASERVLNILHEKEEDTSRTVAPPIKLHGGIRFNNVSFTYPTRPDNTVLNSLTFEIRPGEKVALIGRSGSGKSTIINLLLRFYPLSKGTITIDGQDIEGLNLSAYRQNLGIVPQEVILFGGTIRENIAYGKPGATEEEVREAARKANALEFIERFDEKLETLVGERGVKLSGGQRQRIAIARAILKDPAILILDEATSSLDAHTEVLVQEALEKLMEGRTTIIIAHRLSTVKKTDRIFVIQDGALAETGSHAELTQQENGIYSNLLKLQLQ